MVEEPIAVDVLDKSVPTRTPSVMLSGDLHRRREEDFLIIEWHLLMSTCSMPATHSQVHCYCLVNRDIGCCCFGCTKLSLTYCKAEETSRGFFLVATAVQLGTEGLYTAHREG